MATQRECCKRITFHLLSIALRPALIFYAVCTTYAFHSCPAPCFGFQLPVTRPWRELPPPSLQPPKTNNNRLRIASNSTSACAVLWRSPYSRDDSIQKHDLQPILTGTGLKTTLLAIHPGGQSGPSLVPTVSLARFRSNINMSSLDISFKYVVTRHSVIAPTFLSHLCPALPRKVSFFCNLLVAAPSTIFPRLPPRSQEDLPSALPWCVRVYMRSLPGELAEQSSVPSVGTLQSRSVPIGATSSAWLSAGSMSISMPLLRSSCCVEYSEFV